VKCGRCSGSFHLDAIYELFNANPTTPLSKDLAEYKSIHPYIIIPSKDTLEQSHDEWYCPLCLKEDTTTQMTPRTPPLTLKGVSPHLMHPKEASTKRSLGSTAVSSYYLNEWGCSVSLPWLLHPAHSNEFALLMDSSPSMRRLLEALTVLTSDKSSIIPLHKPSELNEDEDSLISWSFKDRIALLAGLCEVLKSSPAGADVFNKVNAECIKLGIYVYMYLCECILVSIYIWMSTDIHIYRYKCMYKYAFI
jgi:hypothetical protein